MDIASSNLLVVGFNLSGLVISVKGRASSSLHFYTSFVTNNANMLLLKMNDKWKPTIKFM